MEEMTADAIIVATGSVNAVPPIPGLKENPNCIDSTGALSLEQLPKSMVVIGGGVIGLELACAYAAFGTKITVVEAMDHMLPMLDGDLTTIGVAHMKKMGMEFNLECPVQAVEASPCGRQGGVQKQGWRDCAFEAEKVLVAIGRKANTASLNLEAGGLNDRGRILVNDKMETMGEEERYGASMGAKPSTVQYPIYLLSLPDSEQDTGVELQGVLRERRGVSFSPLLVHADLL